MNQIDEIALIGLVRKYPLLYDITSPLYNDPHKKEEAWNEISILTSASAYDCKTKWTRLRDNYRKALIVRNKNTGRAKDRAVKFEKQLSFLNEKFSFTPRKKCIMMNLDPVPYDNPVSDEPPVKVLAQETSSQASEPKAPKKPVKQVHELNAFFEGIAETVKTFPKKLQIQLKREVFNLVNDAESSLLENQNENALYYSMDSPMVGGISGYVANTVTDSPSGTSASNEYNASPNHLQASADTPEQYCAIDIKSEMLWLSELRRELCLVFLHKIESEMRRSIDKLKTPRELLELASRSGSGREDGSLW